MSVSLNKVCWNSAMFFHDRSSVAVPGSSKSSSVAATETTRPSKPEIGLSGPLQKKLC